TASQPQDGNSRDTLLGGRYGQTASQPAAIAGPDRPLWEASKTGTPALQCAQTHIDRVPACTRGHWSLASGLRGDAITVCEEQAGPDIRFAHCVQATPAEVGQWSVARPSGIEACNAFPVQPPDGRPLFAVPQPRRLPTRGLAEGLPGRDPNADPRCAQSRCGRAVGTETRGKEAWDALLQVVRQESPRLADHGHGEGRSTSTNRCRL